MDEDSLAKYPPPAGDPKKDIWQELEELDRSPAVVRFQGLMNVLISGLFTLLSLGVFFLFLFNDGGWGSLLALVGLWVFPVFFLPGWRMLITGKLPQKKQRSES